MKKKLGLCFILVFLAVFAAIFVPWDRLSVIKDRILGVGESYSSLKVYSLGGDMKVFIDGEERGIAKEKESYLEVFPVSIGEYEVKLVREASVEGFYSDFTRRINFEKGFDTVISWEIGPTEESSSGWVLYARGTSIPQEGATLINLNCHPESCNLKINGESDLQAPIYHKELTLDQQYTIQASMDGYQDLEFQILSEESEARSKLEGYELFFEVNLYKIPI